MTTDTQLKIYYDKDIDTSKLLGKKVAVVGYGSQGYGQTLNLRDSGVCVKSALRPDGASAKKAKMEGLDVLTIEDAVKWADVFQILIGGVSTSSTSNFKIRYTSRRIYFFKYERTGYIPI